MTVLESIKLAESSRGAGHLPVLWADKERCRWYECAEHEGYGVVLRADGQVWCYRGSHVPYAVETR